MTQTNPDTLLPCPFCGGEAVVKNADFGLIGCSNCQALESLHVWNNRPPPSPDRKRALDQLERAEYFFKHGYWVAYMSSIFIKN